MKSQEQVNKLAIALKRENRKLTSQVVRYQAEVFSLKGKIVALEKQLKKMSQKTNLEDLIVGSQKKDS